ncbi:MAG: NAD(P)/FAD-dependent oxidoreductase [Natronosporangium sp.]
MTRERADVVVIGGGPAGATCAADLASAGRSVLLLERTPFPRFHVGESLLPFMAGLLEQLDLLDHVRRQSYVAKCGAEFTDDTGGFHRVSFDNQGPGRHHCTFQVERAHFDELLLAHARACGARVVNPATVDDVLVEAGRVVGVTFRRGGVRHEVRAAHVVDASGRSGKVAKRFGLRRAIPGLRMVAVYRHFAGVDEGLNPGWNGDIQIGSHDAGWVWAIPIWRDTLSVGTVMKKTELADRSPAKVFEDHLHRIPRIAERLAGARACNDVRVETDYCYFSDQLAGPGWTMVGDAGCFVDPIFSGGVYLAMVSARKAAATLLRTLAAPAEADQAWREYQNFYKTGYDSYIRLIHGFYAQGFDFRKYRAMLADDVDDRSVALLLSGDFWSPTNAFTRLLRQQRQWDTFAPYQVYHGCPVYPELELSERAASRPLDRAR